VLQHDLDPLEAPAYKLFPLEGGREVSEQFAEFIKQATRPCSNSSLEACM
jgi:hypothetical protein